MRCPWVQPSDRIDQFLPCGARTSLPPSRLDCRNLLSADGRFLLGLRGWDIPHDRHLILTELQTWQADMTGQALPLKWYALERISTIPQRGRFD